MSDKKRRGRPRLQKYSGFEVFENQVSATNKVIEIYNSLPDKKISAIGFDKESNTVYLVLNGEILDDSVCISCTVGSNEISYRPLTGDCIDYSTYEEASEIFAAYEVKYKEEQKQAIDNGVLE